MTKRLKGSKTLHASNESCHVMYVTETKITFCDYFSNFIHFLATLRQIALETMVGVIIHGNLFNKTIIYERILENLLLYTLPKT